MSRLASIIGLLVILALAVAARAARLDQVFTEDGSVIFAVGDAFYHAHRALFSFLHFPDFLRFDPCINWPLGASVPHAPLYDLALAGLARTFTDSEAGFERVAAWLPVGLGALTILPVYALAAGLRGRAAGLGAACLYAVLPIAVAYSHVGNLDHHAAVGLEGAVLLALYVAALAPDTGTRRLVWIALGLTLSRVALLGTWHGSLLYFPLGEGAILLFGVLHDKRPLLLAQAASLLGTGVLIAPLVAATATPAAGAWSASELSLLHLLALAATASLAAGAAWAQRSWPLASGQRRLARLLLGALLLGVGALALPGVREGIVPAFEFLTKRDDWGHRVLEQMSLFHQQGELRASAALRHLAYYAYLLPLVPVSFWLLSGSPLLRARALFLVVWTIVFGALAVSQVRFANDFAPALCVAFSILLTNMACELNRRTRVSRFAAASASLAVGTLLWLPAVPEYFLPGAQDSDWSSPGDETDAADQSRDVALQTIAGTQVRFAERVLAATPATPGCAGTRDVPDYGILADPVLGHVLHKVAHRATPADPFGPYIGEAAYRDVMRFLTSEDEQEAIALAEHLRTPFVALAEGARGQPRARISRRLMSEDGSADGKLAHLEHFRLATEGPAGGVSFRVAFEPEVASAIPYKLFEIVRGAILVAEAAPGARVSAQLAVTTPTGRRFQFFATDLADELGLARLRVPYWTGGHEPTRAAGPYRLASGEVRWTAEVSEEQVRRGEIVRATVVPTVR